MYIKRNFIADNAHINELVDFVKDSLIKYGIKKEDYLKAMLTVEEAAGSLIDHRSVQDNEYPGEILISIKAFLGTVNIELSAKGTKYSLESNMSPIKFDDIYSEDVQESISRIILGSMTDSIKYSHKNGGNYIRMTVIRSRKAFLYQTIGSMILAIIIGWIFAGIFPESFNKGLNDTILVPVRTMYMNALKMIVGPVVFFSIISCIVQFSDLKSLGRIGGKIMGFYFFTTILAISIGIGVFYLIQPGGMPVDMSAIKDTSAITSQNVDISIKDTIIGIIPSDIITPFLKANMLQLIFLAVICGIATGQLGKYSNTLIDIFYACNDLFLKVTSLIIKVMPIAVFCSIMSMMITMGVKTIISVLGMFGTFLIGLGILMIVYCLLLLMIGKLNPITFVRKYAPYMLQAFSLASSNASIPVNMEACEKKLGINKKIYSLSIPLGATINMDGSCIHLAVFALTLAKIYNVEITETTLFSMIIAIIVLSIGAPGIPGAGLICLSVLLVPMNVPIEAIGLVMGIDSLCGMFRCMNNCLGDVVVSTIVAKSEGQLDIEMYNS